MDQSFSVDNFKKILSIENRKGKNLEKEFFPSIFDTTKEITELNDQINSQLRNCDVNQEVIAKLIEEKLKKKDHKQELIDSHMRLISEKLSEPEFKITIEKVETDYKPIYKTKNTAENFFAIKQLQYNVRKSFNVKQANRFAIVNQLNSLLTDNFPKIVLRTDVKSFYESIPHDKLIAKINDNPLLSFLSKKIIWKILKDFLEESGATEKVGIPRGIGVSAYLAELYMRDIDKEISTLVDVTYYARYVDDIIIIFTPTSKKNVTTYINQVKKIIEIDTGLSMNLKPEKTIEIDLVRSNALMELNYLGYKFVFKDLKFVQIKLTDEKINKYKKRITNAIEEFNAQSNWDSRKARRLLIHRLNFLTGNTRLENNKSNVLIGIYYTNSLLTEPFEDLLLLNSFLKDEIDLKILNPDLRNRLQLFSFSDGFKEKKYVNFSSKTKRITLEEIFKTM